MDDKQIENLPLEAKRKLVSKRLSELAFKKKKIRDDWVQNNRCECVRRLKPGKSARRRNSRTR